MVYKYIDTYNSKRIHLSIGNKTLDEIYNNWLKSYNITKSQLLQNVA